MAAGMQLDCAAELKRGTPLADVIERLEPDLTSEEDAVRGAAVAGLVKATGEVPACVQTPAALNTVASFFTDKLTDRACVGAALEGCLQLVRLHGAEAALGSPAPQLQPEVAARIERTLLRELPIASLSHDNRRLCLLLLLALTQACGQQLLQQGVRMLGDVSQVVDGERDPRCLLVAFDLIRAVVALYEAEQPQALEAQAEELCDVVACYFPITFRLPPNAAHGITRDSLAAALQPVLASTRAFAPFVLPLLLDKLASSLWQAKSDALSALAACLEAWGPAAAAPQLPRVWWALREELTEPTVPDAAAEGGRSTAVAAAECLRRCLAARERHPPPPDAPPLQTLLGQVLEDEHVADLPQWLAEAAAAGESATTARRFAVANEVLAAAAGAAPATCAALLQRLHPSLLSHIEAGAPVPAGLELSSALALFRGAAEGAAGRQGGWEAPPADFVAAFAGWGGSLAAAVLAQLGQADAAASEGGGTKAGLLRVRLLAQLAAFSPGGPQPLAPEQAAAALAALAAAVVSEASPPELAHEAGVGVAAVAGAGHSAAVEQQVLPALLAAAARPAAAQAAASQERAQSPPLACLVAVLRASAALRSAALGRLCEAVLELLAAPGPGQAQAGLLLAALAGEVLPACVRPFEAAEAAAAASLAQGLVSAAPTLPQEEEPGVVRRAAEAAQAATAGCSAADQAGIAAAAAAALASMTGDGAGGLAAEVADGAAVPAAALTALRPGVAVGDAPAAALDCLRALLTAGLRARSAWAADAAMAAAAAALLKRPAGSVEDAVALALDDTALPQIQLQLPSEGAGRRLRAVRLLGWLGRGLAMRGHARAGVPLEVAASYLESASLDLAAAEEEGGAGDGGSLEGSDAGEEGDVFDASEARCMAELFATVVGPGTGVACLDSSVHAAGRILWQQKAFEQAAGELAAKLQEGEAFLGAPPPPLLLALAHLAGACTPRVVAGALPRLLPWLLAALPALADGPLQDGPALLAALGTLERALEQETGRALLEPELPALIAGLLACVRFKPDARVRAGALACLERCARQLPYDRLHPHRKAVLAGLAAAVDDPKRDVRRQAAKARRPWLPA